MIRYAGVPLATPDAAKLAALEAGLDWPSLTSFERVAWLGGRRLGWAVPALLRDRPRRLQTLYWPRSASRWAVGYFVVTKNRLDQIRQVVYSGPNQYQPATLTLDDGARSLLTGLWMLPPRPLDQVAGDGQLYLLTLVDDRYFWWEKRGKIAFTYGAFGWDNLFAELATALGITLASSTPAAYQMASPSLRSTDDALPLLLDAAAFNVGRRVVRKLDGTVLLQSPQDALASAAAEFNPGSHPERRKTFGGQFAFAPPPGDLNGLVPASLSILFPLTLGGVPTGDTWPLQTTLASLALPEFAGVAGHPGTKRFADELDADFLLESQLPDNYSTLLGLAGQFAADWYRWQLGALALELAGLPAFAPDGLHDRLWTHRPPGQGGLRCSVERGAFDETVDQLQHSTAGPSSGVPSSSVSRAQPTVADTLGATVVPNTTGLLFDAGMTVTQPFPGVAQVAAPGSTVIINITNIDFITNVYDVVNVTNVRYGDTFYIFGSACAFLGSYTWTPCGWFNNCTCTLVPLPGSGSGSGFGGGSGGACSKTPQTCANCVGRTPQFWDAVVTGFAGSCAAFNGAWRFNQNNSCTWLELKALGVSGVIDFPFANVIQLTLTWAFPGGIQQLQAVYTASFAGNCCSPATLTLYSSTCGTSPGTITITPTCCDPGGGGGGIVTGCQCTLPATVHFTWTSAAFVQPGIPASIALAYDAASSSWTACVQDSVTTTNWWLFRLKCVFNQWTFNVGGSPAVTAHSVGCSPLAITFVGVGSGFGTSVNCTDGNGTGQTLDTVTVTL